MPPPRTARCGTDAGYKRHRKLGQDACDPCKVAHAIANRARYVRKHGPPQPRRYCTTCGGQTRSKNPKCSICRKIEGGEHEPVWVLRGGIWRDANKASA